MNKLVKRDKPRLIQGILLKCVDGVWIDRDGLTPPSEMLVIGTTRGLQCWGREQDLLDEIPETSDEPLPDLDALNAQIPEDEWGPGLDGKPRPPWTFNWIVYLLDPATASTYTFINRTWGAQQAVEQLEDRIKWMRTLRGNAVAPIVQLDRRPMKIKRLGGAVKMRPEFTVVDWRDLSGDQKPAQLPPPDDKDPAGAAAKPPAEKQKKVGKPVKPVTIQEELNDDLPDDLAPPKNILRAG
jgi:hypothetical protein